MRRVVTTVVGLLLIGGLAACSSSSKSSSSSSSSSAVATTQAPTTTLGTTPSGIAIGGGAGSQFCTDVTNLDKALSSAQTPDAVATALKGQTSTISDMESNLPSGTAGQEGKVVADAMTAAATSGDGNKLIGDTTVAADGADMDTYCGQDGDGKPLPADFGQGTSTDACTHFDKINAAVSKATTADQVNAAIQASADDITAFSNDVSTLPSNLASEGQLLVTTAKAGDGNAFLNPSQQVGAAVQDISLYCGHNN